MKRPRWVRWTALAGIVLFQTQGCQIDQDLLLRSGLNFASDLTVFLVDNFLFQLQT